jgi:hypothetical protein
MGLLILIAALLANETPQFQVETVDGASVVGTLVRLNGQEAVVGDRTFKLSDVRFMGALPTNAAPTNATPSAGTQSSGSGTSSSKPSETSTVVLETLDGAHLSGIGYEVTKGVARLKLSASETIDVPTKYIHRVDFSLGGKSGAWPELPKDAAGDLIVVQKKDAIDLVEGVVGDVTADTVQFSVEGDIVPVKRTKVVGLIYFHASQANSPPDATAIVENTAGWKLSAKEVALADGKLAITTTFGATLSWPLESVRAIDFSPSRMVYLSDLSPDSSDWTPLLDFGKQTEALSQFYKPRFDRALDGGSLSIGGKPFRKGVAMAAHTVLEYKIGGRGREFRATAGIDDSVHGAGSVKLTIDGDGKTLYTGKITGREKPADLSFDVSGVKRLRIIADFGGGADVGDYLDLGDARIVK